MRWQEPVETLARSLALPEDAGLAAWLRALEAAVGETMPPLRGRFRGRTAQELRVSVELRAVEEASF